MKTIDLTPTWSGVLNWFLSVLSDGDAKGKEIAMQELRKMAQAADMAVEMSEERKPFDYECEFFVRILSRVEDAIFNRNIYPALIDIFLSCTNKSLEARRFCIDMARDIAIECRRDKYMAGEEIDTVIDKHISAFNNRLEELADRKVLVIYRAYNEDANSDYKVTTFKEIVSDKFIGKHWRKQFILHLSVYGHAYTEGNNSFYQLV